MKARERSLSRKTDGKRKSSSGRKTSELERSFSNTSSFSEKAHFTWNGGSNLTSSSRLEDESFSQQLENDVFINRRSSDTGSLGTNSDSDDSRDGVSKVHYDVNVSDSLFSHPIYENAAQIFAYLAGDITVEHLPFLPNDFHKRRVFSLAFAAHRYKSVLHDVLLDSSFYTENSKFEGNFDSQVKVLLLDYYNHGYCFSGNKRKLLVEDSRTHIPHIYEIQNAMIKMKVKISSAFARNRIKACSLNLEGFLPDVMQERKKLATHQPLYVRMSYEKKDLMGILDSLSSEGFVFCEDCPDLESLQAREFTRDPHFEDLLVFSRDCKDEIYSHIFTQYGILIPQDKTKYLVAETAKACFMDAAMQREKANMLVAGDGLPLVQDQEDILLAYPECGAVISHLASIMERDRRIFICGCSKSRKVELSRQLAKLPVQTINIDLLEESFLTMNLNEDRFKKVKLIVCNAPCSKSGVINLEDFILQESSEHLKQLVNHVDAGKLQAIISEEQMCLRYALKFPQVQSVVYFTNSVNKDENEFLVMRTMKEYLFETLSKNPFEMQSFLSELVCNLRSHLQEAAERHHARPLQFNEAEKYLRIPPSSVMNGFFVALLKRKYLDASPREIIERAAKTAAGKGGKGSKKKKKKKGSKKGSKKDPVMLQSEDEAIENSYLMPATEETRIGSPSTCDSGIYIEASQKDIAEYDNHSRKVAKTKTKTKKKKKRSVKTRSESPHKH